MTTQNHASTFVESGYAPVNGLEMYYEIHGSGQPLVLLHGNLSAIGTSFGKVLPQLAATRRIIAVEQQGHGHTADIDRPFSIAQWAQDTTVLLRHLLIEQADFFGYSSGGAVALEIARIAPHPEQWHRLVAKIADLDRGSGDGDWSDEALASVKAPALLIIGDSDIVRPEHTVAMFRLLGGGVPGDLVGLPRSQLAILPGTTHVTLVDRAEWLVSMIDAFLDIPLPVAK